MATNYMKHHSEFYFEFAVVGFSGARYSLIDTTQQIDLSDKTAI
jgi:hypothetical protein